MKKITIILTSMIFVASIVVVNLFGLAYDTGYQETQFVEKIEIVTAITGNDSEILNCNFMDKDENGNYTISKEVEEVNGIISYTIKIRFNGAYNPLTGKGTFLALGIRALPDNSKNKEIVYSCGGNLDGYSENSVYGIIKDDMNYPIFYFNQSGTRVFQIYSADGGVRAGKVSLTINATTRG